VDKLYYDGDASKIIGERLILELIQDKKIVVRDNKILFNICHNKGTTRTGMPIYTMGSMYADNMYKKAFEGSWIYVDDKDILRIDYDNEALERLLLIKKEDEGNDNRTS
jgi:hypothetical protein